MTEDVDGLVLSSPEFTLLGLLGDGPPLVVERVPPLDAAAWAAVFDGLAARGVLAADPATGHVVVADGVRLLVDPLTNPRLVARAVAADAGGAERELRPGEVLLLAPSDPTLAIDVTLALLALPAGAER